MTFASLASQGSPSPTHRAATVSRGPRKVWGGVTWAVCEGELPDQALSLECSPQRKPLSVHVCFTTILQQVAAQAWVGRWV